MPVMHGLAQHSMQSVRGLGSCIEGVIDIHGLHACRQRAPGGEGGTLAGQADVEEMGVAEAAPSEAQWCAQVASWWPHGVARTAM